MDEQKAHAIENEIAGNNLGNWQIKKLLGFGKSAAVFLGEYDSQKSAIKIFDTELIQKFGDNALEARIDRERSLIGSDHPNLVKMLDSNICSHTGYHFLAMEFLEGCSLDLCLNEIPTQEVSSLIEQLAAAAQFLEEKGLAHRDIKPANILVSPDFKKATLLDLGVLKPVGLEGLTDEGGYPIFVGTNQYASPEFALRQEEDCVDGWRAVTFYQLGAVLHDMIARSPLFGEHIKVPGRLHEAIQSEVPQIRSNEVDPKLIALAQNCMVKLPKNRLQLVGWSSFKNEPETGAKNLELRSRIRERLAAAETIQAEKTRLSSGENDPSERYLKELKDLISESLSSVGRVEPNLGRRLVYETNVGQAIQCDFQPSNLNCIPYGLSICIQPLVMCPTDKLVKISGSTWINNTVSETQNRENFVLYEGGFPNDDIVKQVEDYVLSAVDSAQSNALKDED